MEKERRSSPLKQTLRISQAERGLEVLHKNPHLIPQAKALIEANEGAISEALRRMREG